MARTYRYFREHLGPPDPTLLEIGAGGERLFAYIRLIFWLFMWLAPLGAIVASRGEPLIEIWIAFGAITVAILFSMIVVIVVPRGKRIRSLGYIGSALDVTLITTVLGAVAMAGHAVAVVNSQIAWPVYLLVIFSTSLRYDIWHCLLVGLLCIVEYIALIWWITASNGIPVTMYSELGDGSTSLIYQIVRVMLMIATTAITIGVISRSRESIFTSGTDRLTGLGNRAYFEERIAPEIARAFRSARTLTLAIIDLDFFKQFNDRWGHDAGDEALRLVAQIIKEEVRGEDVATRWGGEEFALVFPDTTKSIALRIVERIRKRVANGGLAIKRRNVQLTLSCGLAQFPEDGTEAESLFSAADRRLLTAKRSGRNRLVADDYNMG